MPICLSERAGDVVGFVDGVSVGEEKMAASGGLGAGPACVALAGESTAAAQVQRRSASRRITPSCVAAASAAISRVRSVEASLIMISSHCWPRAKPGSDLVRSEARQAGNEGSSLRAGTMTESSRLGCSGGFGASECSVSVTTSYYRKWSVLCVESG